MSALCLHRSACLCLLVTALTVLPVSAPQAEPLDPMSFASLGALAPNDGSVSFNTDELRVTLFPPGPGAPDRAEEAPEMS
jgi:hypothetical protein